MHVLCRSLSSTIELVFASVVDLIIAKVNRALTALFGIIARQLVIPKFVISLLLLNLDLLLLVPMGLVCLHLDFALVVIFDYGLN